MWACANVGWIAAATAGWLGQLGNLLTEYFGRLCVFVLLADRLGVSSFQLVGDLDVEIVFGGKASFEGDMPDVDGTGASSRAVVQLRLFVAGVSAM